jgi:hypothetical protein
MTRIIAPEVCPDCGEGIVQPLAKAGRTRRGGQQIPADIKIPTCNHCGAEWMDDETALALASLDKKNDVKLALEALIGLINLALFLSLLIGVVGLLTMALNFILEKLI